MSDLPNRITHRLSQYDYNTCGAYFVTICTYHRRNTLSRIVGALHEAPEVQLTAYGCIVKRVIEDLPQRFRIQIPKYVIMPNHIHLLVVIDDPVGVRALREAPLQSRSLLSKIVGYLKMNTTKEIHKHHPSERVWQRLFYDHIVRNDQDYSEIWQYIDYNPIKWWLKQETI